ncbi:MAG: multicomponent Na+:H+ antiporter subunit C [Candidatus Azotimanducaceae bacterium]|jgi:multicomponent Na+:H+ antiporter subunit C
MSIYFATSASLFAMGLVALILRQNAIVRLMALNLMGIAVFLWLVNWARAGGVIDAIPHALVLTGIVVAVSTTAFGLALLVKIHRLKDGDNS